MNRKIIFIILLVIIAISTVGYFTFFKKSVPYASKEECEQATGKECYLFQGLCQVMEARNQSEAEASEKFLRECLPKIGTWQPVETTSQSTSSPQAEVDNWKIYRSEEYGLEFRYPADWKVVKDYSVPVRGFIQLQQEGSIAGGINIIRKPISSSIDSLYEKMFASASQCPVAAGSRNLSSESQYEEYVYCLTGKEISMSARTWKGAVECSASQWYGMKVEPETCPHEFWINTEKFFYVVHFNLFEPIKVGSEKEKFFDKFLKGFSFF